MEENEIASTGHEENNREESRRNSGLQNNSAEQVQHETKEESPSIDSTFDRNLEEDEGAACNIGRERTGDKLSGATAGEKFPPNESTILEFNPNLFQRIEEKIKLFHERNQYEVYKISSTFLFLFCIVLIVSTFVLGIKYRKKSISTVCKTEKCLKTAAFLKFSMNESVNPCENFYEFTCGQWRKNFLISPPAVTRSKIVMISEKIRDAAMKFLTASNKADDIRPVRQIRMFFKSCMNLKESRNLDGFDTILDYLKKVGLPKAPIFFTSPSKDINLDWVEIEAKIRINFNMDIFLGLYIQPDIDNALENLLYLGYPHEKCPMKMPRKGADEKKWKRIMRYIMISFLNSTSNIIPSDDALERAMKIINDFNDLLELDTPRSKFHHTYYTFDILQQFIDNFLAERNYSYPDFVHKYLFNNFKDVKGFTYDIHRQLIYLKGREDLYLKHILTNLMATPKVNIELYLWWSVVVCMVSNTNVGKFIDEQNHEHKPFKHYWKTFQRKKLCTREIIHHMNSVVIYGISQQFFTDKEKIKVMRMFEEIRGAFIESVEENIWLDMKTKKIVLEKLSNVHGMIGFPKWILEKGKLEEYYEEIDMDPKRYLHNLMEISKRQYPINLIREYRDEVGFPQNPVDVNAFNMYTINSVVFPFAMIYFPVYDLGLASLDYGSFGSVIGHELTHTFDKRGRMFDKHGNIRETWTQESLIEFKNKAICLIKQYDKIVLRETRIPMSGETTLNENIADNGGLNHAYKAYQKYSQRFGEDLKLPGFENFSSDQMFFIAYGNLWCQTSMRSYVENEILNDPHPHGLARINVAVSNSIDFGRVFECPVGSKMNPVNKCRMW